MQTDIVFLVAALLSLEPSSSEAVASEQISHELLIKQSWLPKLAKGFRRFFREPRSVKDLQVCEPVKIKWKSGNPVRWTVQFAANSKNGMGGYTGVQTYSAIFRAEKKVRILKTGFSGTDGFNGMINDAIWKQIENCPFVSDSELQSHLNAR